MSRSKDPNPVLIGIGKKCPKCGNDMQRFEHSDMWKPLIGRNYFKFWDRCFPCKHFQHYSNAKVYL